MDRRSAVEELSPDDVVESVMFDEDFSLSETVPELISVPEPAVKAEPPEPVPVPEPVYEPVSEPAETEAKMAESIAQAIAATYHEKPIHILTPEEMGLEPEEPSENPELEPEAEAHTESAPEPEPKRDPEEEPKAEAPQEPSSAGEQPEQAEQRKKPKADKTEKKQEAPAYNSAAARQKIARSRVHVGFLESFALMIGDLRTRQRQDLPDYQASLRSREAYYARVSGLFSILSPVRYILLVLMALALLEIGRAHV